MARSSYVYALFHSHNHQIVGAFTVKREMLDYIKRNSGYHFYALRFRDGNPDAGAVQVDLVEEAA